MSNLEDQSRSCEFYHTITILAMKMQKWWTNLLIQSHVMQVDTAVGCYRNLFWEVFFQNRKNSHIFFKYTFLGLSSLAWIFSIRLCIISILNIGNILYSTHCSGRLTPAHCGPAPLSVRVQSLFIQFLHIMFFFLHKRNTLSFSPSKFFQQTQNSYTIAWTGSFFFRELYICQKYQFWRALKTTH